MAERTKLKVIEVKDPQAIGEKGAQKLVFKATNEESKELWYASFRTSLFQYIKPGELIEVDVDTKTRKYDDATYTDRNIIQLYIDGQPMGGQKGRGLSFQVHDDSPERRASLENQSRAKCITELLKAGVITEDHFLTKKLMGWLSMLGEEAKPTQPIQKQETKAEPKKIEPDKKAGKQPTDLRNIQNFGNLYTACRQDFNMSREEVWKECGVSSQEDITETPSEVYLKIQEVKGKFPP